MVKRARSPIVEYKVCLVGGPCDGTREDSHYGKHYQTIIGRQLVENGLTFVGVYEYQDSHESNGITERRYRYDRTCTVAEALVKIGRSRSM